MMRRRVRKIYGACTDDEEFERQRMHRMNNPYTDEEEFERFMAGCGYEIHDALVGSGFSCISQLITQHAQLDDLILSLPSDLQAKMRICCGGAHIKVWLGVTEELERERTRRGMEMHERVDMLHVLYTAENAATFYDLVEECTGGLHFMNYGYASKKPGAALDLLKIPKAASVSLATQITERAIDSRSLQLYLQLVDGFALKGKRVMEVSSGKGGGIAFLAALGQTDSCLGVDISNANIALCTERYKELAPVLSFQQGDACGELPLHYDVIVNVEASHVYSSRGVFYRNCFRVLSPGGVFLYVDHFDDADALEAAGALMSDAGFDDLGLGFQGRDITEHVLAALAETDGAKRELIAKRIPQWLIPAFGHFCGLKESCLWEEFAARKRTYRMFRLRKPENKTVVIHGKTYDISNFDDHPGGRAWLENIAGTDATTHFEVHHMRIERARTRLANLPVIDAGIYTVEHKDSWEWHADGLYATMRRRAACLLLENVGHVPSSVSDFAISLAPHDKWRQAMTSTMAMRVTRLFAVVLYAVTFFGTCATRSYAMAMLCGMLTAVMGGFGHNALHQRGRTWDCWLLECCGFSHDEWRRIGHTNHHVSTKLDDDFADITKLFLFSRFMVGRDLVNYKPYSGIFRRLISLLVFEFSAAALGFMTQWYDFIDGWRSANVVPLSQLCMLLLSGHCMSWDTKYPDGGLGNHGSIETGLVLQSIGLWLVIWIFGSLWFAHVNYVSHSQERNCEAERSDHFDFGAWQLAVCTDIEIPFGLRGIPLCGMMFIFLHEHTLHHLFPTVDHSRLHSLRPIVESTAEEFGLTMWPPQGYGRVSIGMLATAAGISWSETLTWGRNILKIK